MDAVVPVHLHFPLFAGVALLAVSVAAHAQTPVSPSAPVAVTFRRELVGVVRDPRGTVMAGVAVGVNGDTARTDGRGAFRLTTGDLDTVTLSLRQIGFEPVEAFLTARNRQWDTVLVQMERAATKLANVKVSAAESRAALGLRTFEERRVRGNGIFITRAQIAARNTSRMSDLLRGTRGVSVVRGRVRFVSSSGRGSACAPDIWIDGARARGMEADEVAVGDVEAMELYANFSTVPFEFTPIGANTVPCGTIVIWTRVPNSKAK